MCSTASCFSVTKNNKQKKRGL
jgi:hypothetical protein